MISGEYEIKTARNNNVRNIFNAKYNQITVYAPPHLWLVWKQDHGAVWLARQMPIRPILWHRLPSMGVCCRKLGAAVGRRMGKQWIGYWLLKYSSYLSYSWRPRFLACGCGGHVQHPPTHRLLRLRSLSSAIHRIAAPALLISLMCNMHHYKYMSDL